MPESPRPPPDRAARRYRGLLSVLAALAAVLLVGLVTSSCGSGSGESERVAPRETSAPPSTVPPSTPETPPPRGPSTPEPGAADGVDPRFDTCAQANAHGYGPYVRGWDPEYRWYEDRDHDGVDCEPWLTDLPTWSPDPEQSVPPLPSPPSPSEPPTDVPPPSEPSDGPSDQDTSTEPAPPPSEEPSSPETETPSEPEPPDQGPGEEPSAPGSGDQP
ncbi:excalibur calcium-binding domain-containing protein [Actinomadura soli]|uniref:Excalibur calcium-binding domain-containing protein n=1 Tax=Actinomadura soli TaxID=2508997 RepID=A0A5C4JA59_9ACTN|nr:excalibur calcium-binding domain-containing protein [Actinomadura soli]TMQ98949.1 excalibur calcium-binding domain-containing protein [Actinomadura soli]